MEVGCSLLLPTHELLILHWASAAVLVSGAVCTLSLSLSNKYSMCVCVHSVRGSGAADVHSSLPLQ